jgi:uncharacterized protein with FMN-binding domain
MTIVGTSTPEPSGSGQGSPSSSNTAGGTAQGTGSGASSGNSTGSDNSATGSGTQTAGAFKDGTYTGPVTDAIYGKLEVVATIQGGKLIDTNCPIYPNSGGHTTQVSAEALPMLKQEAIAAQSANINIVSGATQTSQAYQQSLAGALAQAQ